jgi:hypothetical protein
MTTLSLPPQLENFRAIDEKAVSALTGRALKSLQNDRWLGRGIPFFKMGKSCRYRLSDVMEYLSAHRVETRQ